MGLCNLRSEASTKSDRKFEKKVQFYAKVRKTVASLNAKKTITKSKSARRRERKVKAYDLSGLHEFLPELTEPQKTTPANFSLKSKSRQKLLLKEGEKLKVVLNHPIFQSDPLAAIHKHLQMTQQPVEDNRPQQKKGDCIKKNKKKRKSKSSLDSQPMDLRVSQFQFMK